MLDLVAIPLLIQLTAAPDEFFEQTYSQEVTDAVAGRDETNPEALATALEALGAMGDASAYQALGELHTGGELGFARDTAKGCDYYEKVGGARADSLHNLATCYFIGDGRPQDHAKARELYVKAAEAGWRMSFCAYGNMLIRGQGGPVDTEEGIRLCRMTAILGDADAQTDYGGYLLTGVGVERDPVTACFMLEQAGAQGQRNAAFLLGQIHSKGDSTPVDHELAGEWFAKAYQWGRSDAAFEAAKSYLRRGYVDQGDGTYSVKTDLLGVALEWLEIAKEAEQPGSTRLAEVHDLERAIVRIVSEVEKGD